MGKHINLVVATLPQAYLLVYKYKHPFIFSREMDLVNFWQFALVFFCYSFIPSFYG